MGLGCLRLEAVTAGFTAGIRQPSACSDLIPPLGPAFDREGKLLLVWGGSHANAYLSEEDFRM